MKTDPTPFPYDASYEGYPKGYRSTDGQESRLERIDRWWGGILGVVVAGITLGLGAELLHLLGWRALLAGVLLLALGALCGGGIVYLIFRGDEEIGVE